MRKDKKVIPIIDCPICGKEDIPLSYEGTMTKPGNSDIEIWSCSNCGKVPNLAEDIRVKRYISIIELKALGWEETVSKS